MGDKGTSMIETAIAIPVVLFILISIFTLAFAGYNKVIVTSAAREGAREYAVSACQQQAMDAIEDVLSLSFTQLTYDVEFKESVESVEVILLGRQQIFAPGLSAAFSDTSPNSINLLGSAKYRKEGWQ
ncbi:MAG: pilus assembly protein [Firmicutes bacterium]|nr:pilus assembly protein [Bacillota bacterium]